MIIGVLFRCGLGRDLLLDLDLGFDLLSARGLLKLSARSLGSAEPKFSENRKEIISALFISSKVSCQTRVFN